MGRKSSGRQRRTLRSIQDIVHVVYSLIGVIPYLLVVYIFAQGHITLPQTVALFAAITLLLHLLGLRIMQGIVNHVRELVEKTDAEAAERPLLPQSATVPREFLQLADNFRRLHDKLEEANRNYKRVVAQLLAYAHQLDDYRRKLEKEEIMRLKLSRYVGKNVAEQLMRSGGDLPLQNQTREVTILFADIRNFAAIAEHAGPEEMIAMLNEHFHAMVDIVFRYNGVLDKFIGDALMAVFGLMDDPARAPLSAIRAALEMRAANERMMEERRKKGLATYTLGIGINTGRVVVGNVGAADRMDYTVIGDAVNVASRLTHLAGAGEIVVGVDTYKYCADSVRMQKKGKVIVKNRSAPVDCYIVEE